jgi:hypothetical protein
MAFVRRVKTASGATALQVREYLPGGGERVVQHIGSANSKAELGVLAVAAKRALDAYERPGQGTFDFEVPGAELDLLTVPGPESATAEDDGLFLFESVDAGTSPVASALRVSSGVFPGKVVGTSSDLLFDTLVEVYRQVGFDALANDAFRDLVIARIVEPTSLLDAPRVLDQLGKKAASYSTLRRTLQRCHDLAFRDQIAELCFAFAHQFSDISLVMYDVTTLHWEADKEDNLRKVGFNKQRKVDPQVIVGLLVDRRGFPLEISCFEGNKAETLTIVDVVDGFKSRHGIEDMVVVADAGMMSATNLAKLDEAGYRFIVGSRAVRAPHDLESHFRWNGDIDVDGTTIDTITPKHRGAAPENDTNLRAEPVWTKEQFPSSWRAVWSYSAKRFTRDNLTLTRQIERAQDIIDGKKVARRPRYLKATTTGLALDQSTIDRARKVAGLKGYVTNIPASIMPAREVIANYHDLWNVEQSFRITKNDLAARPLFARRRDAIEAHLTVVFAALAIARVIQQRSGLSIRKVLRTLEPLRSATIAINGVTETFPTVLSEGDRKLVEAILERPITD